MGGLDQGQRSLGVVTCQMQQSEAVQRLDRAGMQQGAVGGLGGVEIGGLMRSAGLFQGCEHDGSLPRHP